MVNSIEKPETASDVLNPKKPDAVRRKGLILLIVGIIILIAIVVFLVYMIFSLPSAKSSWSAVFLTNGRTYFGQIAKQNSNVVVLQNVYYIQVQEMEPTEEGEQPQPQLSLVNVSDELHGPESEMQINWTHILFIQKLKQDSQVVATIEQQQLER